MIINVIINTRYFYIDIKDGTPQRAANVFFCNDPSVRARLLNLDEAQAQIGSLLFDNTFQWYGFGFTVIDATYITEDKDADDISADVAFLAKNIKKHVDSFMTFLWFVKDNCACIDYVYGQSTSEKRPIPSALLYSSDNVVTAGCEFIESVFTKEEMQHALHLWEKSKLICENFNDELVPDEKDFMTGEELGNPTNRYVIGKAKHHVYNRIERALLFLDRARMSTDILLKIANYCSVLECLFSTERDHIQYKISQRVSLYVGNDFEEREWTRKFIVNAYNVRSAYVHGSKITEDEIKGKRGERDKLKDPPQFSNEGLLLTSTRLDNLLRVIFTKVILDDSSYFLDDKKLFDLFNIFIYEPTYIHGRKTTS